MNYLEMHIKKYPKMQLVDKVKLLYQSFLGANHFCINYDVALKYMQSELESIVSNRVDDICEEIGDNYVRIYLKPYFERYSSFEKLATAFKKSADEKGDEEGFIQSITALITDENREEIQEYLKIGHPQVSHSHIYKIEYDPHYRIIHKKYLNECLE